MNLTETQELALDRAEAMHRWAHQVRARDHLSTNHRGSARQRRELRRQVARITQ